MSDQVEACSTKLKSPHNLAATHVSSSVQNTPSWLPSPSRLQWQQFRIHRVSHPLVLLLSSPLDICFWPITVYGCNWVFGLAVCPIAHTGLLQSHSPVYQFDVGVALHQHKAAPVPQQGGERRVRDAALDGAVAAIVARCVQVLGHRPAECGRK